MSRVYSVAVAMYNRDVTKHFKKLHVYTDGSSHGNPGPSAYAFLVCDEHDITIHPEKLGFANPTAVYIGKNTNNYAEYSAVQAALQALKAFKIDECKFISDSELVVKQLNGVYKVKNEVLAEIYHTVKSLLGDIAKVTFAHVKRDHPNIYICDRAANAEVDKNETKTPIKKHPKVRNGNNHSFNLTCPKCQKALAVNAQHLMEQHVTCPACHKVFTIKNAQKIIKDLDTLTASYQDTLKKLGDHLDLE